MTLNKINLNSDLAEHDFQFYLKVDKPIILNINSANISCLYHGGRKEVVEEAIIECIRKDVSIGAHISFLDKENFGRTQLEWDENSIHALLREQIDILSSICKNHKVFITHFKLHGALSNMASKDLRLAQTIVSYFKSQYPNLIILAPVLSELAKASHSSGLKTALEVFADRTYEDDGTLTPRSLAGSVITNPKDIVGNLRVMIEKKVIVSRTGLELSAKFNSICIHSDTPNSVEISRQICLLLNSMNLSQNKLTDLF